MQNHAVSNKTQISQQQLYQALLSAANANGNMPFSMSNPGFHQRPISSADAGASGAAQQLAFYNHLYNVQVAAATQQAMQYNAASQQNSPMFEKNQNVVEQQIAAALAIASGSGGVIPQMRLQGAPTTPNLEEQSAPEDSRNFASQLQQRALQNARSEAEHKREPQVNGPNQQQSKSPPLRVGGPQPNFNQIHQEQVPSSDYVLEEGATLDDRKQVKRAANRRSAQLSRKRKKQFIEELKEENDDLRRKEQILKSIPDLVVVFDSAGKLGFVSQSVSRFLEFTSDTLEGTSFWNRLCDESVRLLKAAFMDALAARKPGMDTTSLGDGLWELRLVDKDGKHKIVILNGVVHFTGETPECVCSIRPTDDASVQYLKTSKSAKSYLSTRDTIHPQQSVKNTSSIEETSTTAIRRKPTLPKSKNSSKINPVSDGESVISENASISS